MESFSNDSFLWTEASNDSDDNRKNKGEKLMESYYDGESRSSANFKQNERDTNYAKDKEKETKKKRKKSKKSKYSDATQDSSDYYLSKSEIIKLEPGGCKELEKKRSLDNEKVVDNKDAKHNNLYDEEYLNIRVKQEQTSFVQSKKSKKHRKSNSNTEDNTQDSDCAVEKNIESFVDLQVKQEQVSVVEPDISKFKKRNKKLKICVVSPNLDIASKTKSVSKLSEDTDQDNSATVGDQINYSIIEEKFSADETVVEKPRKKKHKKEDVTKNNTDYDNDSIDVQQKIGIFLEAGGDNSNNNDISLGPGDFSCNNIVSSTVINNSAIDLRDKTINKKEEALKRSKTTKISDRILFEDDNANHQDSLSSKTSTKINMFLKQNPHLRLFAPEIKDHTITNDDEIWTLTLPRGINCEKFRNTTVSTEGRCKVKVEGQTYEGALNEDVITITLLRYRNGQPFITNIPIKNCINFQKRIPKVHIPANNTMINNQKIFTPLPEMKCRHPLFGAHYKKVIKISTAVTERLQAAKGQYSGNSSQTSNKKKHKKNQYKSADIKMEEDSVCERPDSEPLKKKKKRKHSLDDNDPPKKRKRLKHNADSSAVWESEKAIEENLFNF